MAAHSLSPRKSAWTTVAVQGVPVFRAQAWALLHAYLNGARFELQSGDRRQGVAERFGHQSQAQLYDGWIHHRPGYYPANPPGVSSHELRSDGSWFYSRFASRAHAIPSFALGIDAVDRGASNDARKLVSELNHLGYRAVLPYPGQSSENHHFSFSASPKTRARAKLLYYSVRHRTKYLRAMEALT